jgi:NAD(P)-dependent dehydrogenase (short-subunit alcohol dehydrogenase family)
MPEPATDGGPAVLVTGAFGDIGRRTVAVVAARGGQVVTMDRTPLPGDVAALVCREITVDLTDDANVARHLEARDMPAVRHVIAVAGGGDVDELSQQDPATESLEIFNRVVVNNLHAAFVTVRNTVPLLRRQPGDRSITLVGSINAYGGYGAPGYSAAKAGLSGLVAALATPLGAEGMRINCLALGTVDTANLRHLAEARGRRHDLGAVAEKAPLHRVLTSDDVARSLAAMALDMPGLTGTTVVLDNGQTLIR